MKHCRFIYIIACLAVGLLLEACGEKEPLHIKIVCTSDVHGNLLSHDFLADSPMEGGLARVSSYLKELRRQSATNGGEVIYIDNGDMLLGQPTTYYYNTEAIGQKHLAAEALNYLKCNAVVLGNNDIKTGGPTYQRYANDLDCPIVCGNIMLEDSDRPFFTPYIVIERQGVKIVFLGLTTPIVPYQSPYALWKGMEFEDMERSASRWMKHLKEHVNPDIVIGVFHSGYEEGVSTNGCIENATRAVAERVPGFDAIFYGHIHQEQVQKITNIEGDTVLLINPANNAEKVALVDIEVGKGKEYKLNASLVDMKGYEPDQEYMNAFSSHFERINRYVNRTIGTSPHEARMTDAIFGPSRLVDFIHQMQLDVSGAKISFAAPLSDVTLPEGEVKIRDIYRLMPYENTLYILWLTGREVKDYLEMSYSQWTNQMKQKEDHLLLLTNDNSTLQYHYHNFDSAAGIIYEVDVTQPIGKKISIKQMADGTPFNPSAKYMVVMNSYRANGGGRLLTEGARITHDTLLKRIEYTTTADLRFYLISYVEMNKKLNPQPLNQWKFVPESWADPAAIRDSNLLFGKE